MLTKRTNILFDKKSYSYLEDLAKKQVTSVGDLIRKAVIKVYIEPSETNEKMEAYNQILKLKKRLPHISTKEIKESIHYGHKF